MKNYNGGTHKTWTPDFHINQDRSVELNLNKLVTSDEAIVTIPEKLIDDIYYALSEFETEEEKKENEEYGLGNFGQVSQKKQTDRSYQIKSEMNDSYTESLRPDYDRV